MTRVGAGEPARPAYPVTNGRAGPGEGRSGRRDEGRRAHARGRAATRAVRAAEGGEGGRRRRGGRPAPRAQAPPGRRRPVPPGRPGGPGRAGGGGGAPDRGLPSRGALRRGAAAPGDRRRGRGRRPGARRHGPRHVGGDAQGGRPRRRQARGAEGPGGAGRVVRRQLELPNEVAAGLAGSEDAILKALEGHLDCDVFLRGNVVTLEGAGEAVDAGETVVRELSDLITEGHEIAPGTIEAVTRALDAHESPARILEDVVWRHRSSKVAPKTLNQKRYVDSIRRNTVTFGIGPAGTGKTFLAVAMSVAALSRREVNRIILTRPAVEAGERLGFLPGDMMAKVDPYLRPLFDALHDMLDPERVSQYLERGTIEVAPLAFMRGRTLSDSFIILDEAQNTTPEQMKMFLTRLGFNSRMVVTGDITQVDLPRDQRSGLVVIGDILQDVEGIRFVRFGGEDVVRHKLVQRIVAAYNEFAEKQAPELRPAREQRSR